LLKRLGYRVTGFTHADKALAAFQADPMQYDLVVTDFNLPNSSGLEIAAQLLAIRPEIPIILASGEVSGTLTRQAQLAGVRHVVYKPNTVDDLCRAIHRLANGM
jgi:CheY-like chemotaxis protein